MLTLAIGAGGWWSVVLLRRAAQRARAEEQARRLGTPRRWHLPARPRALLERALEAAAVDLTPEGACELWLASVVALVILTMAIAPALVPLVALAGIAAVPIALRLARERARRKFVAAVPGVLEQIAAGLRGGVTIAEAIDVVADGRGPIASDFRRIRARAALGSSLPDSLAVWPDERPLASVRASAGALAVAASVGGPAATALDGLAASLRERLGATAEARALSAQARISAVVVGVAPAGYLAFSALVDARSMHTLVATGTGRVCLVVGLGLELLAMLWMRRIVRAEDPA